MYEGHWFGGGFMWIFWILLILVIVWAVKASVGTGGGAPPSNRSPLEILRERYAKGEIDQETYDRMKKELES